MSDEIPTHPVAIDFEPRFCGNHVADLTAGCSFGCVYCPFSDIGARRRGVSRPSRLDLRALTDLPAPPSIFLSPASDAFAPQAVAGTHALLAHLLPRGTTVGVVTKGLIPKPTLRLLAAHRGQVEGVMVGLSSLDDRRNGIVEPGCPGARERLANLRRIADAGLMTGLRLDPLFPVLDDARPALDALLDEAVSAGAWAITATYVFAWGRYLRRMRREPLLVDACGLLTEKAPMEGGTAFSVPLAHKLETYAWLAENAAARGLWFNTCGCKDVRVRKDGRFTTACRNSWFLTARGEPTTPIGACRAPAGGALPVPRAAPRP